MRFRAINSSFAFTAVARRCCVFLSRQLGLITILFASAVGSSIFSPTFVSKMSHTWKIIVNYLWHWMIECHCEASVKTCSFLRQLEVLISEASLNREHWLKWKTFTPLDTFPWSQLKFPFSLDDLDSSSFYWHAKQNSFRFTWCLEQLSASTRCWRSEFPSKERSFLASFLRIFSRPRKVIRETRSAGRK